MDAPPRDRKTPNRFDRPASRPGRDADRPRPDDRPRTDDRPRQDHLGPRGQGPGDRPPFRHDDRRGGPQRGGPHPGPSVSGDPAARHRPNADEPHRERDAPGEHRGPPPDLVTGVHPVLGLLRSAPQRVREVLLWSQDARVIAQVRDAAAQAQVPVVEKNHPWFDNDPGNPQGVAVRVSEFVYSGLDAVVPEAGCPDGTLILVLDSITDPRNLGAILRSAAFFGVSAVIVPQDRAAGVTAVVERVSRAATATVPVVRVVNLARTLEIIKDRGVFVVGTGLEPGSDDLATFRFPPATALVLGAEGSGLRPLVRKKCDTLVKLSGFGDMQSLNVSSFATLALHIARAQLPLPTQT